jgi:hypothetical protein
MRDGLKGGKGASLLLAGEEAMSSFLGLSWNSSAAFDDPVASHRSSQNASNAALEVYGSSYYRHFDLKRATMQRIESITLYSSFLRV